MTENDLTPELMQQLAKSLDSELNPNQKGRIGFAIFVYPHSGLPADALYISNSNQQTLIQALDRWLNAKKLEISIGPPPVDQLAQQMETIMAQEKQKVLEKYQGTRILDTVTGLEDDFKEVDWFIVSTYPQRFKIVGDSTGEEVNNG